jgi:hypothetical protein
MLLGKDRVGQDIEDLCSSLDQSLRTGNIYSFRHSVNGYPLQERVKLRADAINEIPVP